MKTLVVALALLLAPAVARADVPVLAAPDLLALRAAFEEVCPLLEGEAYTLDLIAHERSNPTGVVDLRELHTLGLELQNTRAALKVARKNNTGGLAVIRRVFKAPLGLTLCGKWATFGPAPEGD